MYKQISMTVIMGQIHFGDVPGFLKQLNKERNIQTNIRTLVNITVAD